MVLGQDFSAVRPAEWLHRQRADTAPSSPPTKLPEDLTVTNAADTCE